MWLHLHVGPLQAYHRKAEEEDVDEGGEAEEFEDGGEAEEVEDGSKAKDSVQSKKYMVQRII